MITVGAFEAKTKFSELLDRVERGEEVVITRRGRTVARLLGAGPDDREARIADALQCFDDVREDLRRRGVSFGLDDIRRAVDEGRR